MTNNEKIQKAEQLIAEANALLNEVKSTYDNKKDVIAKYKEDYCKGKKYYINDDSNTSWIVTPNAYTFKNTSNPYKFYLTEELAEQAKKLKDFNDKLLAFKYCYDLDYKPSWDNDCQKYYIYYSTVDNEYHADGLSSMREPLVYFSTKEIAQKCADWLNSFKEVES